MRYAAICRKWQHHYDDLETAKAHAAKEAIRANRGAQIHERVDGDWKLLLLFSKHEWRLATVRDKAWNVADDVFGSNDAGDM
jgi:hypothetical protein